jgi:hypothetical protein
MARIVVDWRGMKDIAHRLVICYLLYPKLGTWILGSDHQIIFEDTVVIRESQGQTSSGKIVFLPIISEL